MPNDEVFISYTIYYEIIMKNLSLCLVCMSLLLHLPCSQCQHIMDV